MLHKYIPNWLNSDCLTFLRQHIGREKTTYFNSNTVASLMQIAYLPKFILIEDWLLYSFKEKTL